MKRSLLGLLAVVFLFGLLSLSHTFRREVRVTVQTTLARLSSPASTRFPDIDTRGLTAEQKQIISLSKQEYAKKPVSYDDSVLTYTQGSKEAWCADYISWVYMQSGHPFKNPNSGSWRIPGVYTLQQYFQSIHKYQPVGKYQPKAGDVAIYSHGAGHAAIVLSHQNANITTIGGNESGRLRIDTRPQTGKDSYELIGYGVL